MQGGLDADLRRQSAENHIARDVNGFAVGGLRYFQWQGVSIFFSKIGEFAVEERAKMNFGERFTFPQTFCPKTSHGTSWVLALPWISSFAVPLELICSTVYFRQELPDSVVHWYHRDNCS